MIILQETGFFVIKPKTLSIEIFRDSAEIVVGTYANEVIEKIYDSIIGNYKDLKTDYYNYFADEFDNFSVFLEKRYNADEECVRIIIDKLTTHDVIFHKRPDYGYDNFIEMLFSDELFEVLNRLTEI